MSVPRANGAAPAQWRTATICAHHPVWDENHLFDVNVPYDAPLIIVEVWADDARSFMIVGEVRPKQPRHSHNVLNMLT